MVIIMAEGGTGSTKTMFLVYAARVAERGGINFMLRRRYRTAYDIIANFALYFCHRPVVELDRTGRVTYRPSCRCPEAQEGGTLNPLDLVDRAYHNREFKDYTAVAAHEWHRWNEARITNMLPKKAKLKRILMSYLYDETRKAHFDFMLDTQSRDKVDNRLREFSQFLVICQNHAVDREWDYPIPHYTVFIDPFAHHTQMFEFYPPKSWSDALMPMYNTWERPKWRSEAEVAVEELMEMEKEMRDFKDKLKRMEETPLYAEAERQGKKARRAREKLEKTSEEIAA